MSDTYRRYRAIRTALLQGLGPLKGHPMRRLNTLVALVVSSSFCKLDGLVFP